MDVVSGAGASLAREAHGKFEDELRTRFEELQNGIVHMHQADLMRLVHMYGDDDSRMSNHPSEENFGGACSLPPKETFPLRSRKKHHTADGGLGKRVAAPRDTESAAEGTPPRKEGKNQSRSFQTVSDAYEFQTMGSQVTESSEDRIKDFEGLDEKVSRAVEVDDSMHQSHTVSSPKSPAESHVGRSLSRPHRPSLLWSTTSSSSTTQGTMSMNLQMGPGTLPKSGTKPALGETTSRPVSFALPEAGDAGNSEYRSRHRDTLNHIGSFADSTRGSYLAVPGRSSEPVSEYLALPGRATDHSASDRGSQDVGNMTSLLANMGSASLGQYQQSNRHAVGQPPVVSRTGSTTSTAFRRRNSCELLQVWDVNMDREFTSNLSHISLFSRTSAFNMLLMNSTESSLEGGIWHEYVSTKCDKYVGPFVMQPNSLKRITLDVVGLFLIICDSIMIPLQLFHIQETALVSNIFWIERIFWTLDSMTMFLAGYISDSGDIEVRPAKTVRHYVSTWALPDAIWLILDWGEVAVVEIVSSEEKEMDIVRKVRYGRYFRILRIFKLSEMVKHLGDRFRSEKVILLVNLTKNFTLVLGVAHIVACLWYAIGSSRTDGWVDWRGSDDFVELYTLSLHWSMAQFAGSDFDILPQNNVERTFAIVIVLFCFVVSACFVSSITSYLTRLQILTSKGAHQIVTLRRYLEDKNISRQLNVRVQRNAQHAVLEKQRNTPESEVELLRLISEPLLIELHFEEYVPILRWHAFFDLYQEKNPGCMRRLCHSGVSLKTVFPGDVIFSLGEIPQQPTMFFVMSGRMDYEQDGRRKAKICAGRWISEPVLWVHWTHAGILRAVSDCQILSLSAEAFQSITSQFKLTWFHPAYYAAEYFMHLREAHDAAELSDIDAPSLCVTLTCKAYEERLALSLRGSAQNGRKFQSVLGAMMPHAHDGKSPALRERSGTNLSVLGHPANFSFTQVGRRLSALVTHTMLPGRRRSQLVAPNVQIQEDNIPPSSDGLSQSTLASSWEKGSQDTHQTENSLSSIAKVEDTSQHIVEDLT